MTPEERLEFEELKKTVEILKNATDPAFIKAIERFGRFVAVQDSTKLVADEEQAVDEAGSSTYNVLTSPDGFVSISGYNIPYYD